MIRLGRAYALPVTGVRAEAGSCMGLRFLPVDLIARPTAGKEKWGST